MTDNNIQIRKATPQDLPYIYDICLKTGFIGKDASQLYNDPNMLGFFYAAPYIIFDSESCFVATINNIPKGYILSAKDSSAFYEWLETTWLPVIRLYYQNDFKPKTINEEKMLKTINSTVNAKDPMFNDYPAHLHIDLLPELQEKGIGRKLFETLLEYLKSQNVKGVHLGVSRRNKNALCFYEKMHLHQIREEPWGFMLGKNL